MSDQYHWKKANERNDVELFCSACNEATGSSLAVVEERETPDFMCEKENGQQVGLELTKIISHPETRQWHQLFGSGPIHCSSEIAAAISYAAFEKAAKLRKGGWRTSDTILVLQLFDNPLNEAHRGLNHIGADEFTESGFAEIWISDHSTIEAYGRVDLFGLYPKKMAGYYALTLGCKPYG